MIATMSLVTAAGALLSVAWRNEIAALISAAGVLGVLVASRVFGFRELVLVASRRVSDRSLDCSFGEPSADQGQAVCGSTTGLGQLANGLGDSDRFC